MRRPGGWVRGLLGVMMGLACWVWCSRSDCSDNGNSTAILHSQFRGLHGRAALSLASCGLRSSRGSVPLTASPCLPACLPACLLLHRVAALEDRQKALTALCERQVEDARASRDEEVARCREEAAAAAGARAAEKAELIAGEWV